MNGKVISSLSTLINENRSEENIDVIEELIADSFEEFVKEKSFYKLPTDRILKIVEKSEIEDIELLCELIFNMNENKSEDSVLLLNVINPKKATFEECIKVLSNFTHSPICKRNGELFEEYTKHTEINHEQEIKQLKQEIEELKNGKPKKETKKPKKEKLKKEAEDQQKNHLPPGAERIPDFESNIFKAAEEGKLESVKFLIEHCHAYVETINVEGFTPLSIASSKGHLDVIKYLYEVCHANPETENCLRPTPICIASRSGHFEVVKYLYETCHVDVEKSDFYGNTSINLASREGHLDVVKYLYETCHANVETKAKDECTPMNNASINGRLDVAKYLYETCHSDNFGSFDLSEEQKERLIKQKSASRKALKHYFKAAKRNTKIAALLQGSFKNIKTEEK